VERYRIEMKSRAPAPWGIDDYLANILFTPVMLVFGCTYWLVHWLVVLTKKLLRKNNQKVAEKVPENLFSELEDGVPCVIELILYDYSVIVKRDNNKELFEFLYSDIQEIHFSERYRCIRISGKHLYFKNSKAFGKIKTDTRFIYLDYDLAYSVLNAFERISCMTIKRMN